MTTSMCRNSARLDIDREKKFVDKTDALDDGCIVWRGFVTRDGYGRFWDGTSSRLPHRVSYEMYVGEIPSGLEIDHLCKNRLCVNPDHLEPVTRQENIARSDAGKPARDKTHCPQGHSYSGDNLYQHGGRRSCRICRNAAARRYKNKQEHQSRG